MQGEFEKVIGSLIREHVFAKPLRLSDVPSWQGHIPFAYFLVSLLKPHTLVELGTHKGDSYSAFCQTVQTLGMQTRCFAVDTWQGDDHAGQYSDEIYNDFSQFNSNNFSNFSTLLREKFEDAVVKFDDNSVDILHIDGLHTYGAVKSDFETWAPKLSDRAVVLFHDTQVHDGDFGVWKLWEELSKEYPSQEFMHSHGLGILGYGSSLDENMKNFLGQSAHEWSYVRTFFERLGTACSATGTTLRLQGDLGRAQKEHEHLLGVVSAQSVEAQREQNHLKSTLSVIQSILEDEQQKAERLKEYIDALRQSTSWKITRPLRAVARVLRGTRTS
ncbi:class I SAM-dependent methyltransferase [Bosea lathyri]|uniref:Methyltransferase domain-containing protein n=1 Tax=Bosea lathyri TaxID=1036778 RepID=A0A1H6D5Y5_9HYPH|nr:class I SAM-dependent methyltransferase [Bosea lathyri]SEG80193.1 Methyltransferase domain-containing protein [Bosea lathyri]